MPLSQLLQLWRHRCLGQTISDWYDIQVWRDLLSAVCFMLAPLNAVRIQVAEVRCASTVVDLFKKDLRVYLGHNGFEPIWSDLEEGTNEDTACMVALYQPADRLSSVEVVRALQRKCPSAGEGPLA